VWFVGELGAVESTTPLVTNQQLYLAIGIPMLFNASVLGLIVVLINAKFDSINSKFDGVNTKFDGVNTKFDGVNTKFDAVYARFDAMDKRFDDMRDLWRAELRRVEEVLDARLKHLESRR
jgi:hypothetical protein